MSGAQQGPKGCGLGGGQVCRRAMGLVPGWGPAQNGGSDPSDRGPVAQPRGGYSGLV
jgi:hypothetical protein